MVEDADGNVVEIVETEVDVVVDGAGTSPRSVATEVDEVLDADGEVEAVIETEVDVEVGADGDVTEVTATEAVDVDRRRRGGAVMRDPHNVLIRPVVSEKSYALMDNNVYVFVVDPSATKIDVRHAVEQAFNVRVDNVNTLNRKGKTKRNRKNNDLRPPPRHQAGHRHPAAGDSIDLFEN